MLKPKPVTLDPAKLPLDRMPVEQLLKVLPEHSPLFEALSGAPVAMGQPLPPTDYLV